MIKDIKAALDSKSCETERGLAFLDVLNVVSGKWKMVLICIIQQDKLRFSVIQKLIPEISPRMLSRELKELELNGIVKRTMYDTKPVTIEYSITDSAKELVPIIMEMVAWGVGHRQKNIIRK
ncbi:helix-turn-helix domain-containing protein [Pedobacter sp. L105]|uniref:winged helix-turn-helix transcriptional regulator n=1 Tax=Pedobacter sp. L105 TaxID=1641871 RepID=UPI00131AEEA3|nr:helix-turn-helix domain-containing protein [Pedobacter sp. L105]